MPPQQEKQKKVETGPSRNWWQRTFGSTPATPEMEEGIRIAKSEIPNLATVQPYGFLSRLLQPKAMGYTSPGRNIYLNPATMQGQGAQDVADTIIHEQEHANQMTNRGYGPTRELLYQMFSGSNEPYHRRPDEIAAFQAEKLRRSRMGRMQTAIPSFTTGEFYAPQDVILPYEGTVKTGPTSSKLKKLVK